MSAQTVIKNKIDIGYINEQAKLDLPGLVAASEERYRSQVVKTAEHIAKNIDHYKIILIAGPSASGKTTTSLILRKTLYSLGVKSVAIALDDFFIDRDQLPLLPSGEKDYESVHCMDIEKIRSCFNELLENGRSQIPIFDFELGGRSGYNEVKISKDHVVIVEGIHGLNPIIFPSGHDDNFYKIYISVKTEYAKEEQVCLNSRNVRLMRRLIRDYNYRGSSVENTLSMWKNVCRGEEMNIRPFRLGANVWIDSLHLYEPLVYQHYLLPVLQEVPKNSKYDRQIRYLKDTLSLYGDASVKMVPEDSMLREFVG